MFHRFAAAALAAACLAAPVAAQMHSSISLADWSARVGRELDRTLRYPHAMMSGQAPSGVVRVKFNCSESGRPDKVTLLKTSGDGALDQAALRAVSRIASLHPLPQGLKPDQRYVATILFARDYDDYTAQITSLRAAATKANGWYKAPPAIALADDDTPAG